MKLIVDLFQRHTLRAVPVSEVKYEWKDKNTRFWVYGLDHRVHAPDYPQQCCCGCTIIQVSAIQTNRQAFAFCASLGQGFLVRKRGKKSTSEASRARDFSSSSSLRGRRLKGKGKGVLGARETRGARAPPVSLAPKTPFTFPFKRLPRRLLFFRIQESTRWNLESKLDCLGPLHGAR